MNNATYPQTYVNSVGPFTVLRTEEVKGDLKTLVSVGRLDFSSSAWLSDDELRLLATMLTEAHQTSKPLFAQAA